MATPPWRSCVEFLKSVKLLSSSVELDEVDKLAVLLIDGVLLCDLVNLLKPESVKESNIYRRYSSNHISQFKWCKNISRFIDACRDFLHVPESFLFQIEDINDLEFEKVINLLAYISQSAFARRLAARPFWSEQMPSEISLYENLTERVGERYEEYIPVIEYYQYNPNVSVPITSIAKDPLSVYTEIIPCSATKLVYILQELLDHEAGYLEKLSGLEDCSLKLQSIISLGDNEMLFFKISELAKVQRNFYTDLKQAIDNILYCVESYGVNKDVLTLGHVFQNFKLELARANKHRLLGFPDSINVLNRYKENEEIKYHLDFKLISVLQAPHQHICQSNLILERLSKNSEEKYANDINEALSASSDLCKFLNTYDTSEGQMPLKDWIDSLRGFPEDKFEFLKINKLISDDKLKLVRTSKNANFEAKTEMCYVFFFEISFIICSKSKNCYDFLEQINFIDISILTQFDLYTRSSFLVLIEDINSREIQMIFDSKEKRDQIYGILNNSTKYVKLENKFINGHELEAKCFLAECCSGCSKLFDGLGYLCKVCQQTFHVDCTGTISCKISTLPQDLIRADQQSGSPLKLVEQVSDKEQDILQKLASSSKQLSIKPVLYSRCILDIPLSKSNIESKLWYFGDISYEESEVLLADKPIGTFFIRQSVEKNKYRLCVKNVNEVSQCLIEELKKGRKINFLAESYTFDHIDKLINFFRNNPLSDVYDTIHSMTTLKVALLKQTTFRAEFSWTGIKQREFLTINHCDTITILDTTNEESGFWLAVSNNHRGLLPWAFISELIPIPNQILNRNSIRSVSSSETENVMKSSKRRLSKSFHLNK